MCPFVLFSNAGENCRRVGEENQSRGKSHRLSYDTKPMRTSRKEDKNEIKTHDKLQKRGKKRGKYIPIHFLPQKSEREAGKITTMVRDENASAGGKHYRPSRGNYSMVGEIAPIKEITLAFRGKLTHGKGK